MPQRRRLQHPAVAQKTAQKAEKLWKSERLESGRQRESAGTLLPSVGEQMKATAENSPAQTKKAANAGSQVEVYSRS